MALYELGLLVSQVTEMPGIFTSSATLRESVVHLYCDLVDLTGDIAAYIRGRIGGLAPGSATTIKLGVAFGERIDHIWSTKIDICDRTWMLKLNRKSYPISPKQLRQLLNPEASSFRAALFAELSEDLDRAEDVCEWIENGLVEFLRSKDNVLAITGAVGTGKTVLADWIEERLQRPLDHMRYSVLFHSFRELTLLRSCKARR